MIGYKEAIAIDRQIHWLLVSEFITEENCGGWSNFTRTLRTGLDLIDIEVKKIKATPKCPTCGITSMEVRDA